VEAFANFRFMSTFIRLEAIDFGRILDLHYGALKRFGGVHAFGYNSAESEPIWMKYAAL